MVVSSPGEKEGRGGGDVSEGKMGVALEGERAGDAS